MGKEEAMAEKRAYRGSMTVFFSVLTVLFLALISAMAESVRVQGARAKAASVLDLGIFSVFGEYERNLLEEYEVFGVDASYGGEDFQKEKLSERLDFFMKYNIEPTRGTMLTGNTLFPVRTEGSSILRTLLLTDEDGWVFRDQIVQNLKSAAGTELVAEFLEARKKSQEMEKNQKDYEKQEQEAEKALIEAEAAQREEEKAAGGNSGADDGSVVPMDPDGSALPAVQEKPDNPLDLIKKVKKMGILGLVLEDPSSVSMKELVKKELAGERKREKGDLSWERESSGLIGDGIFQEYLFSHFSSAMDTEEKETALSYELEYLLCGKESDEKNLKATVNKLLLLREGVNFVYILADGEMRHSAELLAAAIAGGAPGVTTALAAALLAAWAYGESLLDVRILLAGGKVPAVKTKESFQLTLENLGKLPEVLASCKEKAGEGLDYEAYLQMLFLTGKKKSYPMRALNLIECNLRKKEGMGHFQIDHCIAGLEAEAEWELSPVFAALPEAFLKTGLGAVNYHTRGKFIYEI